MGGGTPSYADVFNSLLQLGPMQAGLRLLQELGVPWDHGESMKCGALLKLFLGGMSA